MFFGIGVSSFLFRSRTESKVFHHGQAGEQHLAKTLTIVPVFAPVALYQSESFTVDC
jgi:hypothetical protein